jgi:uncharacterized protein
MRCWSGRRRKIGRNCLLALLEYHKREARPAWWWYFRRRKMTDDEFVDDGEAIGCLEHDGAAPLDLSTINRRACVRTNGRSGFPPQQHQFDDGDPAEDPREGRHRLGPCRAIDNATGTSGSAEATRSLEAPLPTSIVRGRRFRPGAARGAPPAGLTRFSAATSPISAPRAAPAARAPAVGRVAAVPRARPSRERSSVGSSGRTLVVQGPPGSGKTYRGARLITHLIGQAARSGSLPQSHK